MRTVYYIASTSSMSPVISTGLLQVAFMNLRTRDLILLDTTTKPEFAGIATDSAPPLSRSYQLEGWLALEEEPKATIDWEVKSRTRDIASLSITPPCLLSNSKRRGGSSISSIGIGDIKL